MADDLAGSVDSPVTLAEPTDRVPDDGQRAAWRGERGALWVTAFVAVVTPALAAVDLHLPGRTLLTLAFVLLVPGVPVVSLLRFPDGLRASFAGVISIAVTVLAAAAQVMTGWWQPVIVSAIIGAPTVMAVGLALRKLEPGRGGRNRHWARSWLSSRALPLTGLVLAALSWWAATRMADLDDAGSIGLIGVVGWPYVLSLVLVAAVGAQQLLRRRLDAVVLAVTAAVLIVVVYGFSNVADGQSGVSVAWLHVGYIRFITEHHASFVGLDARAYWPGFFAAGAVLVRLAGLPDASSFLSLSPVFYNLAAIAPLLVIGRVVTRSRRLAWLGVFVYIGGNWFQQDYFSPQATALLTYLVTIALLLWTVSRSSVAPTVGRWPRRVLTAMRRRPELPSGVGSRRSLGWEAALVLLAAAVVVSHQLTPVTLVFALLTFVVTGNTRYRRLWVVVGLCFLGWFTYAATDYWVGHLANVVGGFGEPGSTLNTAVGSRVSGDPTYQLMQKVRLGWSLLYGLAGAAGWLLIRHRREAPVVAGLVAGSGVLVLLGSYGGEVVLRVFVFAAPLLAPLTALLLHRVSRAVLRSQPRLRLGAVLATLLVLGLAVTTTRGVNVAFERVTGDELAASDAVFSRLEKGDAVGFVAFTGAMGRADVGDWTSVALTDTSCAATAVECALVERPEFVVVSRTQDEQGRLQAGEPAGWATDVADELVELGVYQVIYQGDDAEALQLVISGR